MRNKSAHSCRVKIFALRFDKLLESIFCLLLVVEAFSLQKVAEMLEEVLGERSGEYGEMRQNFVAQCIPFEALVMGSVFRHCCGELGPFC